MRYRWRLARVDSAKRKEIESALGLHPLIAHVLVRRGITGPTEAMRFLNPSLDYLYPPELMLGVEVASALIRRHCQLGAKVLIYGDYDVDGITASVIMYELVRELGGDAVVFIPDRNAHGYGLSEKGIASALEACPDPSLVITVDCGIRAVKGVAYLKSKGIDVVITDHHLPGEELPPADAIVNPKQKGCSYPNKDLSGVGVAYKIAEYLLGDRVRFLDLATLGTVADVVPLLDENRIIVAHGLPAISSSPRMGLKALLEASRLSRPTVRSIGFVLGPRINSAGRMYSARRSFDLLIADKEESAKRMAEELCGYNDKRQRVQEDILRRAMEIAREQVSQGRSILLVAEEGWHPGVVGIVASKLVDNFGMPALVVALDGDSGRGSARSLGDFHITNALSRCERYLLEFGGHGLAAGFEVEKRFLDDLHDCLDALAKEELKDARPVMDLDGRLRLDMLSFSLISAMESLAPFGEGNPPPRFLFPGLRIRSDVRRLSRDTVKFWVSDGQTSIPVVGFSMADRVEGIERAEKIDLVASPRVNCYNGWQEARLEMLDWRPSRCS